MPMLKALGLGVAPALLAGLLLLGCEKGPAQRAGERVDEAVD